MTSLSNLITVKLFLFKNGATFFQDPMQLYYFTHCVFLKELDTTDSRRLSSGLVIIKDISSAYRCTTETVS